MFVSQFFSATLATALICAGTMVSASAADRREELPPTPEQLARPTRANSQGPQPLGEWIKSRQRSRTGGMRDSSVAEAHGRENEDVDVVEAPRPTEALLIHGQSDVPRIDTPRLDYSMHSFKQLEGLRAFRRNDPLQEYRESHGQKYELPKNYDFEKTEVGRHFKAERERKQNKALITIIVLGVVLTIRVLSWIGSLAAPAPSKTTAATASDFSNITEPVTK